MVCLLNGKKFLSENELLKLIYVITSTNSNVRIYSIIDNLLVLYGSLPQSGILKVRSFCVMAWKELRTTINHWENSMILSLVQSYVNPMMLHWPFLFLRTLSPLFLSWYQNHHMFSCIDKLIVKKKNVIIFPL